MATGSRPDLALVTALYRTTNAIVRELDQRLGKEHNVTFIQAVTLLAVDSFDRPQPHLVANHLSQQSQTVTGVLDRLERAGHISRKRDLNDRRAVRLELTAAGQRLIERVQDSLAHHLEDVLGGTAPVDRRRLLEGLVALEAAMDGDQ
jgi:DNA-binding MarR family transcriptional regulator